MKRQKLLIIYYNFPPVKVPGAVRIRNFYQACLPYFDKVLALTTSNRRFFLQDPGLETSCPDIHEVPAYDLRWLSLRKKGGNKPYVDISLKERSIIRLVRRMVDSFPLNVLIGDGGLVYILKGYKKGKKLVEKEGVTHLFSTFRPYSDHIIAWLLKRRFPQLYWIADFRDLHVDPATRNVLLPGLQEHINRYILRRANLLTTVSQGLARHLASFNNKIYVLYNGLGCYSQNVPLKPFEKFTIAYTGSLFMDKRDPSLLLETLREMVAAGQLNPQSIQLIYAGRDSIGWQRYMRKYQLESILNDVGFLPMAEARALQSRAHINLLLTYTSPELKGNFTGKLFEYFTARRPILALVNGEKDEEMGNLFDDLNAGLVAYTPQNSKTEIADFISIQFQAWQKTGSVENTFNEENLRRFEWPGMISKLIEFVDTHE